jgi:hypothetical protein
VVDSNAGDDSAAIDDNGENAIDPDRTLEQIVSTDFASTVLRRAALVAQVLATAGIVAWGFITYLQWHEYHSQGASASQQALAALEPVSILLFAAFLGLIGVGCQLVSNWVSLRLTTEYPDEDEEETGVVGG